MRGTLPPFIDTGQTLGGDGIRGLERALPAVDMVGSDPGYLPPTTHVAPPGMFKRSTMGKTFLSMQRLPPLSVVDLVVSPVPMHDRIALFPCQTDGENLTGFLLLLENDLTLLVPVCSTNGHMDGYIWTTCYITPAEYRTSPR